MAEATVEYQSLDISQGNIFMDTDEYREHLFRKMVAELSIPRHYFGTLYRKPVENFGSVDWNKEGF
jgi:hypothetical protein